MKLIKDFPNYRIHKDGVIESNFKYKTNIPCDSWRVVKPIFDRSCGYLIVTLCSGNGVRKNKRVHRLLCESYLPNPESKVHVNHIDGNKLNNSLDNLEWATPQENAKHAVRMGLTKERDLSCSVSVNQLDLLGNFIAEHPSLHEAGRVTNTTWQNIYKVCRGLRNTAGGFKWEYK